MSRDALRRAFRLNECGEGQPVEWYYAKDGNQQGPITMAQLRQLASSGKLEPTDMVFKTGMKDWVEASTVAGLFAARSAPAAPATDEGGFAFGEEKAAAAPARRKGVSRARVDREEEPDEDEPQPRAKRTSGGGGSMGDLLAFRRMVAPTVIMIMFWIGVGGAVLGGLLIVFSAISTGSALAMIGGLVVALLYVPISILIVRLYCELMIVIFRMNETLTDIKNLLERQRNP